MGTLAELGVDTADGTVLLIDPPDDVLAEASRMKPRPAIVGSLMHGEPARRILWWPAPGEVDEPHLARLRWFLQSVEDGKAWIVADSNDAVPASGVAEGRLELASGEVAMGIGPGA